MLHILLCKHWQPMTKEEFYMMDSKTIFKAAGFIPKENQNLYLKRKVPGKVFDVRK
jgi:hypothetical protein